MASSTSDRSETHTDHKSPRGMPGLLCCNGLTNLLLMAIVVLLIWGQADIDDAQTLQNHGESTRIAQQREDDERMSKAVFTLEAISEDIDLMYRTTRECQRALEPMTLELRLIQENTEAIFNNTAELLDLGS